MLELLRNGQAGKSTTPSVPLYLAQEVLITDPLLAAEWLIGLVWPLRAPAFRFLGYAYLVLTCEMLAFHGKHYCPANVYPILIAAGAVAIETWTARLRIARPFVVAAAALAALPFVPDVLPVLPEASFVAFASSRNAVLHIPKGATETEHGRDRSRLPGDWADMHGWPAMAAAVRSVYASLPERDRRDAVVFGGNYGEASAVAFFAPEIPVIGEHNQYWLWGPRGFSGRVVIQINGSCFRSQHLFRSRLRARTLEDPYAIGFENHIPIWICRDPSESLAALWPSIKDYE